MSELLQATAENPSGKGRIEHDFLGELRVPENALYGIHTVRAIRNSVAGNTRLADHPHLLVALGEAKTAAAQANRDLDVLDRKSANAIIRAAVEITRGSHHDQFPISIVQGGGGTASNMNMNEVVANRANQLLNGKIGEYHPVHPNDHVNRSQSTNDVFPTAMCVAAYRCTAETIDKLRAMERALVGRARAYAGSDHLGRTCLRDAVPIPISQVHEAQGQAVTRAISDLATAANALLAVPFGGTAVGTGLGTPDNYQAAALTHLSRLTGLNIQSATSLADGVASLEPFAAVADAMARAGRVLARIAADLRILSSGPVGGLNEIALPSVQAGSSIMPGKVNPVLPELVMQTFYQLSGSAHTIALATGAGELEVTPMGPIAIAEILSGMRRLGDVSLLFAERCIHGLRWRPSAVESNMAGSLADAVAAVDAVGYEAATKTIDPFSHGSFAIAED